MVTDAPVRRTSPPAHDPRIYAIKRFILALFEPTDILEIRRLPSGESTWHVASEIAAQLPRLDRQNALSKQNIYVSANPRRQHGSKGDSGVALARTLFADFDHTTVEQARLAIENARLPKPTLIVNSGHGCHTYWKLTEPMTNLVEWRALQQDLAALVGSDSVVCNPERIMRLPGFENHKPPKAPCELHECDPTRKYDAAALRALIPKQESGASPNAVPVGDTITQHQRNNTLTSLAGTMRRRGFGEDAILAALLKENQKKCDPPLAESEVQIIAKSVAKYPPAVATAVKPVAVRPIEPWQPFPTDLLPIPLATFVREQAAAMDCDQALIALPILAAVASAIGNTRRIRLKHGWREPPILWSVLIAPSGMMKSPTFRAALRPIWRRFERLQSDHRRKFAEYEGQQKQWQATPKEKRGEEPQPPPPHPHPICNDTTTEALADRLAKTPRGTLLAMDELSGWISSFNQYKHGGGNDVERYLSMWSGESLKVDRKQGEQPTTYVPHAALCITGGVQTQVMARAMSHNFFENGLMARLLVAMPPPRAPRWTPNEVSPDTKRAMEDIFDFLYAMEPQPPGLDGQPDPIDLPLTESAQATWIQFVNQHADKLDVLMGSDLAAAWAKFKGYAARFALVIRCVQDANDKVGPQPSPIDEQSIAAGIALAEWFWHEAKRVYVALRESPGERTRRQLMDLIQSKGGRVKARELVRSSRLYSSTEEWEAALEELVKADMGEWKWQPPLPTGGRPAKYFVLDKQPAADSICQE